MQYTQEQQDDINERVQKVNDFIKESQLAFDILSYKVFLKLDVDGSPLFAEKIKVVFQDQKYANIQTNKETTEAKDIDGEEAGQK